MSERPIEAEFREYTRGNLPKQDEPEVYPWAGVVTDPRVLAHLDNMARNYCPDLYEEDMPDKFEDTPYCKMIVRKYGTQSATQSMQMGNMGHLSFFSGFVGYSKDVSGMQTLMALMNMIEEAPVFIAYLYGVMGKGKSNFAMLLFEVFESVYGEDNIYRAANISSDSVDEEIREYSRMVELLEERRERVQAGEDVDEMLMLIDEAAQIFTGSGADSWKARALAKILKLARKAKSNIILVGQDGKDIDPALRALCTTFVEKQSKTSAVFWRDIKNRQGLDKMMKLSGVPETSLDWSTWDEGEFKFEDGDEEDVLTQADLDELVKQHEREMMAILDATTDMTQQEIGDVYEVSDKTVRRAKSKHQDELRDLGLID
ncbi:hypothetical protein OB955_04785 [Halobacteria archaeon AArc-m2/3/4]|uniref:Zona occludens toxin N-terminal domain-containing protein n=1 Tax=Natronoglomus mannanivorans TaxID=2979990 RepID=A0ABT2QAV0_9EURY|nr:hypothetical protein [Halobacteria archaeon AArc-m2/3/4]